MWCDVLVANAWVTRDMLDIKGQAQLSCELKTSLYEDLLVGPPLCSLPSVMSILQDGWVVFSQDVTSP